ncbi:MAG: class I SAM-dependent methyltransferase [Flexilinea sp.]
MMKNSQIIASNELILQMIQTAFEKRADLIAGNPKSAGRLFHGFTEGYPEISLDLYARTVVITSFSKTKQKSSEEFSSICELVKANIPDLKCILLKERFSDDFALQKGRILFGSEPDEEIIEWSIHYKIDLQLNHDSSFYLDSSILRKWLLEHASGKSVLNTFAYTGSLGLAALAGNAEFVFQTDLNPNFLRLFRESADCNNICRDRYQIIPGDFFRITSSLRHQKKMFNLVIIDPPFFSQTNSGRVDQLRHGIQLINKIRPLVSDGGRIIAINNALFLSGKEYWSQLEEICADGFMRIDEIIPVPESFFGGIHDLGHIPADPAPFNHSTKIAVLEVHRKDGRHE